jgi:beta-lactamase regulating signal transducer with metallopeptidase domain
VSVEPSPAFWTEALVILAVGVTVVVSLAALLARVPATAVGRRTVWQAATVALAGLLVAEATGLAGEAAGWLDRRLSSPRQARPPRTGMAPDAPAQAEPDEAGARDEPLWDGGSGAPAAAGSPGGVVWWPGVLWLAGALAVAGRVGLARVLLLAFRRRHRPSPDPALRERVRAVARRLGLRRRVLVLETEGLVGPVAFGMLRPTVALPARFAETFTPAQQEVILAHELTHLAAADPAWHLLAELVTAALWWQPLAWWARHQLRAAGEMAADESSLLVADGPAVLARCLVELGGVLAGTRSAGWLRMAGSGFRSGLGRRVERLVRLDGRAWRPPGRARALAVLALVPAALLAAAVLSTAWARARAFPQGDEPMRYPWKRSLAGLVLAAALGPNTGPGLAGDPPPSPAGDPGLARPDAPAAGADQAPPPEPAPEGPESPQDSARERLQHTDAALRALAKLKQELNVRLLRDHGDNDTKKELEDQLRDIQAKAMRLAEEKAALEAKLKALEAKATEAAVRIKVFRLEHQDPEEMRGVIEALLLNRQGSAGAAGGEGAGPAMGPMGMRPPMGGIMRPMPAGGVAGMMPGMGSGGMGRPDTTWRLAVDKRSRSLIVRGTEQDIRTVADLLAVLDVGEGKGVLRVKNLRVFRLRYANAHEVAGILGALGIDGVVVAAPGGRSIVANGPESALKEIGEVIEAVDVEGKPGPTPPEGGSSRP